MAVKKIKKIIRYLTIPLITVSLIRPILASGLAGWEKEDELDLGEQYKQAAGEMESWFKKPMEFTEYDQEIPEPDLGYYIDNISFKDAYELHYDGNTGVIVSGSRSWNKHPLLQREDIITKIDGKTIKHRSHLEVLVNEMNIGDTISVEIIRNGEKYNKKIPVFSNELDLEENFPRFPKTNKRSRGLGGAGYRPMYIDTDPAGMNTLFGTMGFDELADINNLYHGFDLQVLVGNGYFLGGYGVWTGQKQSINYNINSTVPVFRNLQYTSGYGGMTLDKRYRISDKIMFSTGVMIGGGNTRFSVEQIENNIYWNQIDSDTSGSYNDYLCFKKRFVLCQPRVAVIYRVLPVFWLKFEVGYSLSYSKNGWQQIIDDNKHDIAEPGNNNSLDGLTISISPWFGF